MRAYLHWLVVLFILVGKFSAYPAGKSPEDCKIGNCEEWDEYIHDCVPIPKNCWELETIPAGPTTDCGPCSLGFCDKAIVETKSYDIAVKSCKGKEDHNHPTWAQVTSIARIRPCELTPDLDELAGAFSDLADCCASSPASCAGNTILAVAAISATMASGGTAAMAIAELGAPAVASMLLSLCTCIPCDPCDYVTCGVCTDHGLTPHTTKRKFRLPGGDCP